MDIHFLDPSDVPLPPGEVRIREIVAAPYSDGQRVKLRIHLTPFQERPNMEIEVFNTAGDQVASLSVIESMDYRFEITLHLREPHPDGEYRTRLTVHYPDELAVDTAETVFTVMSPA